MEATEFKIGATYISTVNRDLNLNGLLFKEGDTLTFTITELLPCNKDWKYLRAKVKGSVHDWDRVCIMDLVHVSELPN